MKTMLLLGAAAIGVCGSSAFGAFVNPTMVPGSTFGIGALDLADNNWTYGPLTGNPNNDWWTVGDTFLIREKWVGGSGSAVDLVIGADTFTTATFPIGINKDIENSSGFFWTGFEVLIEPGPGATLSAVTATANAEFDTAVVIDNLDGTFTIVYDQGTGTGVGLGDDTILDFGFDIDGAIDFEITQTPIPTPGAFAVLGLAGLGAARRRR